MAVYMPYQQKRSEGNSLVRRVGWLLYPWCWLSSGKASNFQKSNTRTSCRSTKGHCIYSLFFHTSTHRTWILTVSVLHGSMDPTVRVDWRLKRWGHQAAAGTALAELRQCFRYEPRRCCYQGHSYEVTSVWQTAWADMPLQRQKVDWLFSFDSYRTNSPLKQVNAQY